MKIAINNQYGSFFLVGSVLKYYIQFAGLSLVDAKSIKHKFVDWRECDRTDPNLIRAIEEAISDGAECSLKVLDIPDGIKFIIMDYDGLEWVAEIHRTWH